MGEDTGSAASSVDDLEDGGRRDAAISSAASSDSDLEMNGRTGTGEQTRLMSQLLHPMLISKRAET